MITLEFLEDKDIEEAEAIVSIPDIGSRLNCDNMPLMTGELTGLLLQTEPGTSAKAFKVMDDGMIGIITLNNIHPVHRTSTVGALAIAEDAPNRAKAGIEAVRKVVKYAFDTLNLNRVECRVWEDNKLTPKIVKQMGGTLEATLRQDVFKNGEFIDTLIFGLLRSEWENGKS